MAGKTSTRIRTCDQQVECIVNVIVESDGDDEEDDDDSAIL